MLFAKNYMTLRRKMVQNQIEARGIHNPQVLAIMRKVERHLFVKPQYLNVAYQDGALPIDCDQTISQPYIVALMTDLLELTPTSKVLEIGTGCGYQTAILAELARDVYSVEIISGLVKSAKARLETLNYRNIHLKKGDGYYGWREHAPYDAVLVAAAPTDVPERLIQQLRPGGRMVIPVGGSEQNLLLIQKGLQTDENSIQSLETTEIIRVRFVPMTSGLN
ncbi:Protein-L-isoaspartate O-methyltransferase [Geodia barretti]|jgi:protein-L-isoaspartate(D-aspartate) O-methyltransferase|uniref:protein-L-isoaspartate(D-aspartate) O-methyltransferase n=4 Tax=Geodia barretti TaxID=519541 RepID=A0AA35R4G1_GEOBA|nr:Protein-L-isoaspartate O-methyltransferase [Geodia barretti]